MKRSPPSHPSCIWYELCRSKSLYSHPPSKFSFSKLTRILWLTPFKVYPYFYVPYSFEPNTPLEDIQREIYQFGISLNHAMDLARHNKGHHIVALVLVTGTPFYGYHSQCTTFLKIYILHPQEKQTMVDLLLSSAIMNRVFQPYESHVSFDMQFFLDYNLYGMDWIHVDEDESIKFRLPLPNTPKANLHISHLSESDIHPETVYTSSTVPVQLQSDRVPRESYCELELDVPCTAIINRLGVEERTEKTEGKKLVTSLDALWKDEASRRRTRNIDDPLDETSQTSRQPHIPWITEHESRKVMDEHGRVDPPSYPEQMHLMTAFQSVEALYPERYYQERNLTQEDHFQMSLSNQEHVETQVDMDVLDSFIHTQQEEDQFSDLDDHSALMQLLDDMEERNELRISDVPPMGSGYRVVMDRFDLDQFDGAEDKEDTIKRKKTAEERWEDEKRALRKFKKKHRSSIEKEDEPRSKRPLDKFKRFGKVKNESRACKEKVQIVYESAMNKKKVQTADKSRVSKEKVQIVHDSTVNKEKVQIVDESTVNKEKIQTADKSKVNKEKVQIVHDSTVNKEKVRIVDESTVNKEKIQIAGESTVNKEKVQMTDAFKRRDEIQVKKVPHPLTIKQLKDTPATKDQGVRENYFIKDINGMWSPPSPQASYSAFTHDPPQPSSPTLYESLMNQSFILMQAHISYPPPSITPATAIPEWIYLPPPPTIDDATVSYQEPFYSKSSDVPDFPPVFSNKEFKVPCTDPKLLKEYITKYTIHDIPNLITRWTPSLPSPTWDEVKDWTPQATEHEDSFQLNLKKPKSRTSRIKDTIDYFSLEIHVNTIDDKLPDPETDPVQIVFWCLKTDDEYIKKNSSGYHLGIITLTDLHSTGLRNVELDYVHSEHELFDVLISKIRRYDPDMLVGYELQASSWGYLINRSTHLNIPFLSHLSRIRSTQPKFSVWGSKHTSMYHVTGRHLLNVWRLMKSEINSTSYTLENMVYHFLHKRVPHHSHRTLSDWVIRCVPILKYRATQYYLDRVQLNLELLEMSQVVQRTCECARVLGIEFGSVLSRGSQYRVESVLFRLTKPENFMLISPSRAQVGAQRSLECLPLVMEPETQYYSSPMVVLDFQSLYPSVMIAYNYCYSTCLGRVPPTSTKFGVTEYSPEPGFVHAHKDQITVSPNGIMFVKPEIRKSILATMLTELIETRIMVKKSMKYYNEDPGLLRILDAKQLTLKLLANVTYGYTSASFSGRMPCVEIADSIVKTGREILERSIQFINDHPTWGARVVYGDTDSMFVYFEGKTRQEAFKIGRDIAHTITLMNPAPIKLKFEKVYHPAVLLAKKRYVGFKYSEEQDDPVFEAKGIETVRRDGTPATQRILESSLKILFRTQDMSELKEYLYTQWSDILSNRVPLQEFIIAKEVRMGSYAGRGPNGAIVAQAQMNMDGRAEPQYGERVPYVVVYRGPTDKLKDKVVSPVVFLNDNSLRLDAEYYIRKQIIPPLARVFSLIGIDVMSWYDTMPRRLKLSAQISRVDKPRLIDQYYASTLCVACKKRTTDQVLCVPCQQQSHITLYRLITRRKEAEDKYRQCLAVCSDCSGVPPLPSTEYVDIPCDSLDCPFFYTRLKAIEDMKETEYESIQNKLGQ